VPGKGREGGEERSVCERRRRRDLLLESDDTIEICEKKW